MQRVRGHARAGQPPAELGGEEHIAELGDRVLGQAGNSFCAITQSLEVNALGLVMRVAGNVDNPARRAAGQQRQQCHGQCEVAEVIDAEVNLEAVGRPPAGAADAGVVDKPVRRLAEPQEILSGPAPARQVGQVQKEESHLVASGGGGDRRDRRCTLGLRAAREVHPSASSRQLERGRVADASVRAGHQGGPFCEGGHELGSTRASRRATSSPCLVWRRGRLSRSSASTSRSSVELTGSTAMSEFRLFSSAVSATMRPSVVSTRIDPGSTWVCVVVYSVSASTPSGSPASQLSTCGRPPGGTTSAGGCPARQMASSLVAGLTTTKQQVANSARSGSLFRSAAPWVAPAIPSAGPWPSRAEAGTVL